MLVSASCNRKSWRLKCPQNKSLTGCNFQKSRQRKDLPTHHPAFTHWCLNYSSGRQNYTSKSGKGLKMQILIFSKFFCESEWLGETSPANSLILNSQPPGLGDNKCLLFKASVRCPLLALTNQHRRPLLKREEQTDLRNPVYRVQKQTQNIWNFMCNTFWIIEEKII